VTDPLAVYCEDCGFPFDEHAGKCPDAPGPMDPALWLPCVACKRNLVNVRDGFDTCAACERDA